MGVVSSLKTARDSSMFINKVVKFLYCFYTLKNVFYNEIIICINLFVNNFKKIVHQHMALIFFSSKICKN